MKPNSNLQLTYILSSYWNADISEFSVYPKKTKIPQDTNFFILWIPNNPTEEHLISKIKETFPKIPIDSLISCNINLAIYNENNFVVQKIYAKILPIIPAARLLNQLEIYESEEINKSSIKYNNSIITWALLTKLVFEMLNRSNFIPSLEKKTEVNFKGNWHIFLKNQYDNERFKKIIENCSWEAHNLPANFRILKNSSNLEEKYYTEELWHPSFLFTNYMNTIGDLLIRFILKSKKFGTFEEFYNPEILKEKKRDLNLSWDYKFLKSLLKKDNIFKISRFHETIIPKLINNWTNTTQISTTRFGISLILKLDYPKNNQNEWLLKFYISSQNTDDLISLDEFWRGKNIGNKIYQLVESREQLIESILKSLYIAIKIYPPLKKALNDEYPKEVICTSEEVMNFLSYPKDLLIQSGFNVILPEVFNIGGKQRLSTKMVISIPKKDKIKPKTSSISPIFQLQDILNYKWKVELGSEILKENEIKNIIESDHPLINWRGEWILVEQQDIINLKRILNPSISSGDFNKPEGKINYMEALKLGLSGNIQLEDNGIDYEVIMEGDFNEIINKIKFLNKFEKKSAPKNFNGELRPYQKDGLTWMANMCELNFGLCLADDMGLGKTIEVIALLLYFKEKYPMELGSTLIICPTSVLYNWKLELNKFAPELDILLHHGSNREKDISKFAKCIQPHRIILTSYATVRNDIDLLKTIPFSGIIIDESQNMKNYEAQQTQAIYKLQGQYRICLSGTPIENRLIELWTLFNFLNPGLLGNRTHFQENFIIPIERYYDQDVILKLKKIIAPFILRRVKTDKSIIKDLPDKNEMKIYINLSKEQSSLYQNLAKEALEQFESSSSNNKTKNMLILNLLTKFKQICNHPYQYLHKSIPSGISDKDYKDLISQSPKLKRLLEMIDNVIMNGEKVIIFTQFTQMGDLLEVILNNKYNFPILYFHGSVPAKKREKLIEEFQSDDLNSSPILILSIKAGGTGLNLTKATTVFHYDRWWNPAVEKQATDRAYRIGQTKNVNVYKFITLGTIEEKIDALIEEKKELAESIITSGESWLSQLNDDKLKELISLNL